MLRKSGIRTLKRPWPSHIMDTTRSSNDFRSLVTIKPSTFPFCSARVREILKWPSSNHTTRYGQTHHIYLPHLYSMTGFRVSFQRESEEIAEA